MIDGDQALMAAKEWLAAPPEDRRAIRTAIARMARKTAPIEAMPALCRLLNTLDLIDPESAR